MQVDRNIRQSLTYCLKKNGPFKWSSFVGFTKDELKEHLKKSFKEDMTFENYGKLWGITFYIPRRLYKFESFRDNDLRLCWSLKNLKPDYIQNCYRQKKIIYKKDLDEHGLWDILPSSIDLNKYLV